MAKVPLLYFVHDPKTNLYWDGSYHNYGKDWKSRIRFFRTIAALASSLNLRLIPYSWREEYNRNHPYPQLLDVSLELSYSIRASWRASREKAQQEYIKQHKRTSLSIIQEFCAKNGFVLYAMPEGRTLRSAKKL